ncbi:hypothetical protein KAX02_02815 [candidate division WOR-3 bacterium]|nr:hypothetical protein [candidate division WOR-3 bacterium]
MSRYYDKEGRKYPSVTTIISDCTNSSGALTQWSANMVVEWIRQNCRRNDLCELLDDFFCVSDDDLNKARFEFRNVSKEALDIGSGVHNAIEKHLQGLDYILTTKRAKSSFQAFLNWEKEVNLQPIELEQTVWGDRFAGTLDYYGYYKDKLYVIDWKTSKAFYPEMNYQVAIYRNALQKKTEGCGILRLDKEFGIPYFKDTSKSYEQDLIVFNFMVDLFYARHPKIRKKFEETP